MAKIIDGKLLSQKLKDDLKVKIVDFEKEYNRKIKLAVILVGENPASAVYVKNKIKAAEYVGVESLSFYLPENSTQEQVETLVNDLSDDNTVDGILVQLPLPKHLDEEKILDIIPAEKDVDGFSDKNVGKLMLGKPCIAACTPSGVIEMLKSENIELSGKSAVVIGRSNIVGKPVSLLLLKENCTVTMCHSRTKNLKEICSRADIVIAAIGKAEFVTEDMIKEGAVVIDVGINRTADGLKGDVDYENVVKKASYISPVPGGVGPMTIAMLLNNAYICATRREK